ncbi:C40 family peptidase [Chamaesiphon minutus]|uniref:Cell wall-associated hydrolase, invasion-associated protein n=1 Tax=Chamaesiphon minutus (strain ATCC 27169 / PCC 6605) TaxID=1173020 RepID=K9UF48_CHAP6|nr:NlpC/P60 family protein [Chamaesiphon minutus]AFY93450.1 cell wall-associated hydrolase, invasion-associated protein [Chamaesiphon minutus PCC 6605]
MYQKILVCALLISASILPANANSEERDEIFTSEDLYTVAAEAKSWQGTRYRYGGKDKNGIDCSHFVYAVYNRIFEGYDYRMADEYLHDSDFSPTKSPLVGDVIIFPAVGSSSAHMGIITDVQGKKFIGAQTSTGVKEASFASGSYWGKRPYRILSLLPSD